MNRAAPSGPGPGVPEDATEQLPIGEGAAAPATAWQAPGPVPGTAVPAPARGSAPAPGSAPPPREVGGYRLLRVIGSGGMGEVHEALDGDGNRVALKLLHPHVSRDPASRTRLSREVALLHRVRDPGVARVVDAEVEDEEAFVVTELIDGPTLEQDVGEHGPFSAEEIVMLAHGLASALRAIHAEGIVHRDLKPGNVMLARSGPVLIDFGIAQVIDDERLTQTGLVTGTPGYLDPEVLAGAEPTPACDWWAWAAVLTFASTGRPPFGRGSTAAVLGRVATGRVDLDGVEPTLAAALASALSPDPAHRIDPGVVLAVIDDEIGRDELDDEIAAVVGAEPTGLAHQVLPADAATDVLRGGGGPAGSPAGGPVGGPLPAWGTRADGPPPDGGYRPGAAARSADAWSGDGRSVDGQEPAWGTPAGGSPSAWGAPGASSGPSSGPGSADPGPTRFAPGPAGENPYGRPGDGTYGDRTRVSAQPPAPGASSSDGGVPGAYPPGYGGDRPGPAGPVSYQRNAAGLAAFGDRDGATRWSPGPQPDHVPDWARPPERRPLLGTVAGLALASLAPHAPGVFLVLLVVGAVLAATWGQAISSRRAARFRRGLRRSDTARMVAGLPWHAVIGTLSIALGLVIGLVLAGAVVMGSELLTDEPAGPLVLLAAGLLAVVGTWLAPTSGNARDGVADVAATLSRGRLGRIIVAAALAAVAAVAIGLVLLGAGIDPQWAPFPNLSVR
ncbi:Tyrosine protein kinase:Serine/threonine protein kinase [Actinomycetales bacterium JB111]|nr:Tyrosine protein kinase:Serine/threonine protein kinase [Actinomycetales bacterium JB111]